MDAAAQSALAALVTARTGMAQPGALAGRFAALLQAAPARALSAARGERAALAAFVDELAVGETYFFREPGAFAFAVDEARRVLAWRGGELRVWCAGCASGEEAYALAIELLAAGVESPVVVATDLAASALAKARAAVYRSWSFRGASELVRAPFFEDAGGGMRRVGGDVRARITFVQHNLVSGEAPDGGPFDLVFCRNVLIYFEPAAVDAAVALLRGALVPGGVLVLGASDPPLFGRRGLVPVVREEGVFYRRDGGGARRAVADAAPAS
jgi:chemotaxis protein methyltransferase CheR